MHPKQSFTVPILPVMLQQFACFTFYLVEMRNVNANGRKAQEIANKSKTRDCARGTSYPLLIILNLLEMLPWMRALYLMPSKEGNSSRIGELAGITQNSTRNEFV
ncbi:hypothetical protein AVEN_227152-1 [Araneus ventricosus]|uniref:Uncharacterized protein n=1 Tax=Araneus ventricosus TaxID=182803 RepID=A0A4Y2BXQ1_ARAVE|nr:hypothetical protein AVEN_227152-1 [Araneus ventricosus]